jgi:hypothetical protein
MADISRLSRLLNGVVRGVDLASNELVVNQLKVGGGSGTYLTQTILDKLILTNTATDADGTFDLQYADIAIEAVANAALPSASFTDAAVTGKLLTGYSSAAGTIATTDSILVGFNKINGNVVGVKATADAALPSASFTDAAVTGKLITGFSTGAGVVAATDTILQSLNKIDGNANAAASAASGAQATANAALPSASFTDAAVTGKLITGYSSSPGLIAGTDTILQAINKLNGNLGSALVGAVIYKSTFDASAGNFNAISNPKQGWLYKVSLAGTISGTLFSIGDNMYINKDVTGTPVLADIDLIDNTEAADLLRKGMLTSGQIFVGSASNEAAAVAMSGEASMIASGAVTLANASVIAKVLTGYTAGAGVIAATDSILAGIQKADGNAAAAQSTANAALPSASFTDAAVTSKLITGFSASAGAVVATDSILVALNKIDGNVAGTVAVANAALPSASFTDSAVTSKLITGFSSSAGAVAATDSILVALNKLDGNIAAAVSGSVSQKESMVCGEAYASGLFAVRIAKGAETTGRIYKADFDATTNDNFHVFGLMTSAGKSAADSVDVYKSGKMTVTSHGFTKGLPLYLDAAGVLSQSPSSTALMAVKPVGIVRDANTIEVQILSAYVN